MIEVKTDWLKFFLGAFSGRLTLEAICNTMDLRVGYIPIISGILYSFMMLPVCKKPTTKGEKK
jgi:hypothetical protein